MLIQVVDDSVLARVYTEKIPALRLKSVPSDWPCVLRQRVVFKVVNFRLNLGLMLPTTDLVEIFLGGIINNHFNTRLLGLDAFSILGLKGCVVRVPVRL